MRQAGLNTGANDLIQAKYFRIDVHTLNTNELGCHAIGFLYSNDDMPAVGVGQRGNVFEDLSFIAVGVPVCPLFKLEL